MSLCIIAPCKDSSPGPARDALANFMADYTLRTGSRPTLVTSWLSSNVANVRAQLAARALSSGAERYLWVDDDVVFTTEQAIALLSSSEDVVSAVYTQKRMGAPVVGGATPDGERRGPLVELDVTGFGLLAMRASVLADVVQDQPFECRKDAGRSAGEDEAFSHWWRALGGRLWLHTGVSVGHVGLHVFGAA